MIPRPHYAQPGCVYFICLLRDDLLLRQGDCVYLMRDSRRTPDGHPVRQSYRLLSHVNRDKLDIFRIEKLWKNEKYVPRARRSPGGAERAPASPVEPQPSPVLLFQRGALRLRPPLFPAPRNPPFSIPPFLSQ